MESTKDYQLLKEEKQAAYNSTNPNYFIYNGMILGQRKTGRTTLVQSYTQDETERYVGGEDYMRGPEIYHKLTKAAPTKPGSEELTDVQV